MQNVYIDFDGVLGVFDTSKSLEEVAAAGYSLTLPMIQNMCQAVNMLRLDPDLNKRYDVKLLSAIINDQAGDDKTEVLRREFDDDFADKAVFVRYGESKASYAQDNILLDDFSHNLHEWESNGGIGIKVYNGINGNHGSWHGYAVQTTARPEVIYHTVKGILNQLPTTD